MSKRIVIVSGGELDEEFTLSVLEEGYSHIIGVDKGMEFCISTRSSQVILWGILTA